MRLDVKQPKFFSKKIVTIDLLLVLSLNVVIQGFSMETQVVIKYFLQGV